jgi:hypothetical protein
MNEWFLRSISAVGAGEYEVVFVVADEERTFRFTADEIAVGAEHLLTLKAAEFEAETLYSRGSARAVIQAVMAFHKARAEPVLFSPPGTPPAR